jgi:hypothetical protein
VRLYRARTVVLLTGVALLAGGTFVLSQSPAAAGRQQGSARVKFVLQYRGSLTGTWRQSHTVLVPDANHPYQCVGNDGSGSLTSSVRPGSKPLVYVVEKSGNDIVLQVGASQGLGKGVVTSNRTATEFLMKYSGGECKRVDDPEAGCGANTFVGDVALVRDGNTTNELRLHVHLNWVLEPNLPAGTPTNCGDGITYGTGFRYPTVGGGYTRVLDVKKLLLCGIRSPHGCKVTIRGARSFPYNATQGPETYISNVHSEWSVTFVAAGLCARPLAQCFT